MRHATLCVPVCYIHARARLVASTCIPDGLQRRVNTRVCTCLHCIALHCIAHAASHKPAPPSSAPPFSSYLCTALLTPPLLPSHTNTHTNTHPPLSPDTTHRAPPYDRLRVPQHWPAGMVQPRPGEATLRPRHRPLLQDAENLSKNSIQFIE